MPAVNPQPKTLDTYTSNGTGKYNITFEYELQTDVYVGLYDETTKSYKQTNKDDATNPWGFESETVIEFTNGDPGVDLMIYRATDANNMVSEFYTGSAIRAQDLNYNFEQLLFCVQELTDSLTNQGNTTNDIYDEIADINDELDQIKQDLSDVSGVKFIADVPALNALVLDADDIGTAVQVANSSNWGTATNIEGTPSSFMGASDLKVNLRVTAVTKYQFLSYSVTDPDKRYVNLDGDTMTGPLSLSGAPTDASHAVNKAYADALVGGGDTNTTYDFGLATSGGNAQLQLVGSDGTTDTVTIKPGSNVSFTTDVAGEFAINATGGGGGGLTSVNLGYLDGTITNDAGTNATIPDATTSAKGLMTAADKTTLASALQSSDLGSYLTKTEASSTYQTITGMADYLTKASAATTYQSISGMSAYLTTTAASTTYQTKADMADYLPKDFSSLDLLPV